MPNLNTTMHLDMLRHHRRNRASIPRRLRRAVDALLGRDQLYGMAWGDPDSVAPLRYIRQSYIDPYVRRDHIAVEIGPGGGRWTRYLLGFKAVYAVDYHQAVLAELARTVRQPSVIPIRNNGTDFPTVPDAAVDYLFSFGTFVHLDLDLIDAYLANMRRILKPGANAVIQYADKRKLMAQIDEGFADNDPERMRALVLGHGYRILEEDTSTLWHSSLLRFTI
jgi:SAM-dependent methyltransferase